MSYELWEVIIFPRTFKIFPKNGNYDYEKQIIMKYSYIQWLIFKYIFVFIMQ